MELTATKFHNKFYDYNFSLITKQSYTTLSKREDFVYVIFRWFLAWSSISVQNQIHVEPQSAIFDIKA